MTVVGIPGREVLPLHQRRITAQGIDLDHHLMPDPVGKALTCLLDRVHALESRLDMAVTTPDEEAHCGTCIEECAVSLGSGSAPTPDLIKAH
jgi:serine O-acetyltransferase